MKRAGTMPDTELAAILGVSRHKVACFRYNHGIPNYSLFEWTPAKDKLLKVMSTTEASKLLGVSRYKVIYRKRKLGLTKACG